MVLYVPCSSAAEEHCKWRVWERISRGKKIYRTSKLLRIKGHVAGTYKPTWRRFKYVHLLPNLGRIRPRFSRVSHGPDSASFGAMDFRDPFSACIDIKLCVSIRDLCIPHAHIVILYYVLRGDCATIYGPANAKGTHRKVKYTIYVL